jgi:CheY-like chemotaxis protein
VSESAKPSPPGLLLSDDLIFTSRILGTARDLGFSFKSARSADSLEAMARQQTPHCVLLDLSNPGLNIQRLIQRLREVCDPMPHVVAYGSHVDAETLRAGRDAGCDLVLPRSKFVEALPTALPEWMTATSD